MAQLEVDYNTLKTLEDLDFLEDERSLLFNLKETYSRKQSERIHYLDHSEVPSRRSKKQSVQKTAGKGNLRTGRGFVQEEPPTVCDHGDVDYDDSDEDFEDAQALMPSTGGGRWVDHESLTSDMEISSPIERKSRSVSCHEQFPHPGRWLISSHWAGMLLIQCAKAIHEKETEQVQHLMWVLNRLASPQGDCDERLASYFLYALDGKVKGTGRATQRAIRSGLEKRLKFKAAIPMLQTLREESPWISFGQVAGNGAFLEAFQGEQEIHIVDVSNWTFCVQWPTLIEALATRPEGPPSIRLTSVMIQKEPTFRKVLNQLGDRLQKFAELMGVPFEFNVIEQPEIQKLQPHMLGIRRGEVLGINLHQCLHYLPAEVNKNGGESMRDRAIRILRSCNPEVLVVVEGEADQLTTDFVESFKETYRFVSVFLGSLETKKLSPLQLDGLDKVAKFMVLNNVASAYSDQEESKGDEGVTDHNEVQEVEMHGQQQCGRHKSCNNISWNVYEKREKCYSWNARFVRAGFLPKPFSQNVKDDLHALLNMYVKPGWGFHAFQHSMMLSWRNHAALSVTTWQT